MENNKLVIQEGLKHIGKLNVELHKLKKDVSNLSTFVAKQSIKENSLKKELLLAKNERDFWKNCCKKLEERFETDTKTVDFTSIYFGDVDFDFDKELIK